MRAEIDRYVGHLPVASVAAIRAMCEANAGNFHTAPQGLDDARDTLLREGDPIEAARTALSTATVLEWLGDLDRAARTVESVREALTTTRPRDLRDAAEALLADVEAAWRHPLLLPRRPALLNAFAARGEWDEMSHRVAEAERLLRDHPNPDLEWKTAWRRATGLRGAGRLAEAQRAYRDSALGRRPAPSRVPGLSTVWRRRGSSSWSRHVGWPRHSASRHGPARPRTTRTPPGFDQLGTAVAALEFQLYRGDAPRAAAQRDELLAERAALLEKIRLRDPRWRLVTEPPPADVPAQTRALAATDRTALVLHHRAGRVVAVVLDRNGVTVARRTLDAPTMRAIEAYEHNLRAPDPDPRLTGLTGSTGVTLADLVPDGVAERCAAANTLVVIPHGVLHLLPWATLGHGSGRLFAHTAVGVLPSLATLLAVDREPVTDARIALLGVSEYDGPPLPVPAGRSKTSPRSTATGSWRSPSAGTRLGRGSGSTPGLLTRSSTWLAAAGRSPLTAHRETMQALHDDSPAALPGWSGQTAYGCR